MRILNIVIIGAGYMGTQFFKDKGSWGNFVTALRHEGWSPRISVICDNGIDEEGTAVKARAAQLAESVQGLRPNTFDTFRDFFWRGLTKFLDSWLLIYDTTHPQAKFTHMKLCDRIAGQTNLVYLSEKPVFNTIDKIQEFEQYFSDRFKRLLCADLIELRNDAYLEAKKFLVNRGWTVRSIDAWRAGGSGVKSAIGTQRHGVIGGAILDKGAHDTALIVDLLDQYRTETEGEITKTYVHELCYCWNELNNVPARSYLSESGEQWSGEVGRGERGRPAIGLSVHNVRFNDKYVNFVFDWNGIRLPASEGSEYNRITRILHEASSHFGEDSDRFYFDGLERAVRDKEYGVRCGEDAPFIVREDMIGIVAKLGEVRVLHINCDEGAILVNLLPKGDVEPFVYKRDGEGVDAVYRQGDNRFGSYGAFKNAAITEIVRETCRVLGSVGHGYVPQTDIGWDRIRKSHDLMLRMRDDAVNEIDEGHVALDALDANTEATLGWNIHINKRVD